MFVFSLQVDLKPLREATVAVPAPKITEKRKAEDADASKDLKKVSVAFRLRRLFDEPFDRLKCSQSNRGGCVEIRGWGKTLQGHYRVTNYLVPQVIGCLPISLGT